MEFLCSFNLTVILLKHYTTILKQNTMETGIAENLWVTITLFFYKYLIDLSILKNTPKSCFVSFFPMQAIQRQDDERSVESHI